MGKGKPTFMIAPINLYDHIDEQGVRFKNYIACVAANKLPAACKYCASGLEAVGLLPLLVPDQSLMFFLRMLVSTLSHGCCLKAWTPPGVALADSLDTR